MSPVGTTITDGVATITLDDGKANALSPVMLGAVEAAIDEIVADSSVGAFVLAGRPGRFSAGFDLEVLGAGGPEAERMLLDGFELAERLLGFPVPVVLACTGHAMAMGSFLLCSADYRVGAAGDFRIQANEVAIGLPVPHAAVALLRARLTPAAFDRAVGLAEVTHPRDAVDAGWLDRVVDPEDVVPVAQEVAASSLTLDRAAHLASKRRARSGVLADVRSGIDREYRRALVLS